MVVKIGEKRSTDSVVGRLIDCHGRIRGFLEVVTSMGAAPEMDSDEVKSAARDVRRYFSEALPRHVEDEEKSLLPRLVGKEPELDAAIERMHQEHDVHDPLVSSLLSICDELSGGGEEAGLRERLKSVGAELRRELELHLQQEEAIIFPAIDRWVPKSEQEKIIAEMRTRRSGGT